MKSLLRQESGLRLYPNDAGCQIFREAIAAQDVLPLSDDSGPGQRQQTGVQFKDAEVAACGLILIGDCDHTIGHQPMDPSRAAWSWFGGLDPTGTIVAVIICGEGVASNRCLAKHHAYIACEGRGHVLVRQFARCSLNLQRLFAILRKALRCVQQALTSLRRYRGDRQGGGGRSNGGDQDSEPVKSPRSGHQDWCQPIEWSKGVGSVS
jgi:hypothetical protein